MTRRPERNLPHRTDTALRDYILSTTSVISGIAPFARGFLINPLHISLDCNTQGSSAGGVLPGVNAMVVKCTIVWYLAWFYFKIWNTLRRALHGYYFSLKCFILGQWEIWVKHVLWEPRVHLLCRWLRIDVWLCFANQGEGRHTSYKWKNQTRSGTRWPPHLTSTWTWENQSPTTWPRVSSVVT